MKQRKLLTAEFSSMPLSNANINGAVEKAAAVFASSGYSREDQIRLRLLVEHALCAYQAQLGEETEFQMLLRKTGVHKVIIRVRGAKTDPFTDEREKDEYGSSVFLRNLFAKGTAKVSWHYLAGYNIITATALKENKKFRIPGGAVTVAAALGFLLALLTKRLPDNVFQFLVNDFSAPLLSKLLGLIILVTGPWIFFSILSGICALDDLSTLGKLGHRAIRRFLIITAVMIVFSMAVSFVFFPGLSADEEGAFSLSVLVGMLFDLIPQDLFSPFAEGKMIQVVILAALAGIAVIVLGDRVPRLRELIGEANVFLAEIMQIVSKIIPVAVFLSVYKAIAANSFESFLGVWKVIAANYAAILLFSGAMLLWLWLRTRITPGEFLKKTFPVFTIAFLTGSGTLAMNRNFEVCKQDFGISEKLCDFWIPVSHALFSPSTIVPLVVAAFYSTSYNGTPISAFQLLIVFILVVQLSVASPKVPGGIMATFTLLLSQIGIPFDVVGLLMVANIFCMNIETGMGILIRDMDLVEVANRVEF